MGFLWVAQSAVWWWGAEWVAESWEPELAARLGLMWLASVLELWLERLSVRSLVQLSLVQLSLVAMLAVPLVPSSSGKPSWGSKLAHALELWWAIVLVEE